MGLKGPHGEETDFYLIEDYYPSEGITGSLHRPSALTEDLARRCQELLKKHSDHDFSIRIEFW